jgi:hypothetical protein
MDRGKMGQNQAGSSDDRKKRSFKDLFILLALIPLILLTLLCCGQLAMYSITAAQGDNTSSHLSADYQPWPYDRIPALNVQAFMDDVIQEQALFGTPQPEGTEIVGNYWELPTSTAIAISEGTVTPGLTKSPTAHLPITGTPSPTTAITLTPTKVITSTRVITSTKLPTIIIITPTFTATYLPPPTRTNTPKPPPKITRTPTNTPGPLPTTMTPTITVTYTVTLTHTSTVTHTPTPTSTHTLTPTLTYSPLWPLLENSGATLNGGCHAYFGYRNDNPNEVDIDYGTLNNLNDPPALANPPQPKHFLVGRQYAVFEYTWYSGAPLTWALDGRTAIADWCYP